MRLERFTLRRLALPLGEPYRTAIADITIFDTLFVEITADGRTGFGEATVLTGYTPETPDQSWTVACHLAEAATGMMAEDGLALFEQSRRAMPFTVSGLVMAVEMLGGHEILRACGSVPLLASLNETRPGAIEDSIEEKVAAGYGVLKVKVGWGLEDDLERLALIQRAVAGRVRLRVDANQGYTPEDAVAFVQRMSPEAIELVEQTCVAGDWDAAVAVRKAARESSGVPLMLDESIYDEGDIDRVAELGAADWIKLKLMKVGGLERCVTGLERIRAQGMTPVLGNGVQSDFACWTEACVARRGVDNAGEMVGFLKTSTRLLAEPLVVRDGALILEALPDNVFSPPLDRDALEGCTVETRVFSA